MKQQIELRDIAQLTDTKRKSYRQWWRSRDSAKYGKIDDMDFEDIPRMTLGDMIEFLDDKTPIGELVKIERLIGNNGWIVDSGEVVTDEKYLIDNLWEAVVERL